MTLVAVGAGSEDRVAADGERRTRGRRVRDAIVVGGGLHGLSAALNLARAGQRVTILERSWVGRHSSGGTAAGVRTLNRDLAELPLALEAMDMWHGIEGIVGDDCGFEAHGQLAVAESAEHLTRLASRQALVEGSGYTHEELVDRDELLRLVPNISPHCRGALIVRRDGAADPHRTLKAYRQAAEKAGVEILEGHGVEAIEQRGQDWLVLTGEFSFAAPAIVNAAGAWSAEIAAMVGEEIPLGYKASMMIVTERVAPLLKPVVSVVGQPLSFKQSSQGTLVIGGGLQGSADIAAQRSNVDFLELAKGAKAALDLFPSVGTIRIVRSWAGMEATTSDHLPVIEASTAAPGVFHAFGFSGHGFELVPVVGAVMADLVLRGGTNRPIAAFSSERLRTNLLTPVRQRHSQPGP